MTTRRTAAMCALAVLIPALALAAPRERRGRERARTYLVLRIAEKLDLPDEKAAQIGRLLRDSEAKRNELTERRRETEGKLQKLLEQKDADSGALGPLVEEANRIDEQIALLPEQTMREVQKILTPEQQAKLVLLRPEMQRQIRKALQRRIDAESPRRRGRMR